MAISTGSALLTAGAVPRAKCTLMTVAALPADTAATISGARPATLGAGFFGAAASLAVGVGAESPHAASARPQANAVNRNARLRLVDIRKPPVTHTNRRARTAARTHCPEFLPRQNGRIVHRGKLLEQIRNVPLPEARFTEPGKRARKRRIVPAARDPRGVVQDPQGAQCFNQRELGIVELAEHFVSLHQRSPARLLVRGVTGQKHPQILDAWTGHAIVEI